VYFSKLARPLQTGQQRNTAQLSHVQSMIFSRLHNLMRLHRLFAINAGKLTRSFSNCPHQLIQTGNRRESVTQTKRTGIFCIFAAAKLF